MQVYLLLDIDGEQVKPSVGVNTHGPPSQYAMSQTPDTETVRLGLEIANKVLGFAEGLRREP